MAYVTLVVDLLDIVVLVAVVGMAVDFPVHAMTHVWKDQMLVQRTFNVNPYTLERLDADNDEVNSNNDAQAVVDRSEQMLHESHVEFLHENREEVLHENDEEVLNKSIEQATRDEDFKHASTEEAAEGLTYINEVAVNRTLISIYCGRYSVDLCRFSITEKDW